MKPAVTYPLRALVVLVSAAIAMEVGVLLVGLSMFLSYELAPALYPTTIEVWLMQFDLTRVLVGGVFTLLGGVYGWLWWARENGANCDLGNGQPFE